ncbi:MAG: N-acetylmuramoyl-L-alanine amidase CwlD [Clostridia bacterium]|nr:N-acetylmuramoyl-L-alanine amidase CwlD [Clostridia bacterium]
MGCLLLVGVFWLARTGARLVASQSDDGDYIVVVDSGHGGQDPGKIGIHGELEKDINLQIALRLKKHLEKENVEVVMTREKDQDLADDNAQNRKVQDMKRRCEMIHEIQPDCVISIHQNSYPDESVKGAQVFYYQDSVEGERMAKIIQEKLIDKLDRENHRQAKGNGSYFLLKKTDAPLVIVECGFLSNSEEALLLKDEEYQEKVAEAVCEGTVEYLEGSEKVLS